MKKILFMLIAFVCFNLSTNAITINRDDFYNGVWEIEDTNSEYKVPVVISEGTVTYESGDTSILTVSTDGVVTPLKDGVTEIIVKDDFSEQIIDVVVTAFGEIDKMYEDNYKKIPSTMKFDFVKDYTNFGDNEQMNFIDSVYMAFYEYLPNDISVSLDFAQDEESAEVRLNKVWYLNSDDGYRIVENQADTTKNVSFEYAPFKADEQKKVAEGIKNIKSKYNSYLNETYAKMFDTSNTNNQKLMLDATTIFKDFDSKKIMYNMDARAGDNTPGQAAFMGYMHFGINGVYYGFKEVEVVQVLRIPTLKKGEKMEDAIKNFFEKYLLTDKEQVKVEKGDEDTYVATVSEKQNNSPLAMLLNFFIPNVYADDEKVMEFTVEESDEDFDKTTNLDNVVGDATATPATPKTADNIVIYSLLGVFALAGTAVVTRRLRNN